VTKIVPGVEKALLVSLFTSDDPERLQVVEIDNLVCALGREPRTDFYAPRFSKLKEDLKHRGVFFEIGDVVNGIFRQVAVAVGDGTLAAMIISREEREGKNRRN
jgi:thioredoxin reductase